MGGGGGGRRAPACLVVRQWPVLTRRCRVSRTPLPADDGGLIGRGPNVTALPRLPPNRGHWAVGNWAASADRQIKPSCPQSCPQAQSRSRHRSQSRHCSIPVPSCPVRYPSRFRPVPLPFPPAFPCRFRAVLVPVPSSSVPVLVPGPIQFPDVNGRGTSRDQSRPVTSPVPSHSDLPSGAVPSQPVCFWPVGG